MNRCYSETSLAIVLDHPAQHFSPAFRELHRSTRLKTDILYWNTLEDGMFDRPFNRRVEWDVDLLGGYRWWAPRQTSNLVSRVLATWRKLTADAPDAMIVFGWATPNVGVAIAWSLLHRSTDVYLYGDSTWQAERSGVLGFVRRTGLRLLFNMATGAIATGAFNREFYIRHGMHPSNIAHGNCPADIDFYRTGAQRGARTGGGSPVVIGFAGKLIPRKGVHELLSAAALLESESLWQIRIIGEGPERANLEKMADALKLSARVRFEGFKNQSEMPASLGDCDVVVVPSTRDMRVLVTTEAMAAGCAVIVSSNTAVWGVGDLVQHGHTGLVYESGNIFELAQHLGSLISDREAIAKLVANATSLLQEQGPAAFARRVEAAVSR